MQFKDAQAAYDALADGKVSLKDLRTIVVEFPQLRPHVAAYPGVDQGLLDWLRNLHDPGVDAKLAELGLAGAQPTPSPDPQAGSPITGVPSGFASDDTVIGTAEETVLRNPVGYVRIQQPAVGYSDSPWQATPPQSGTQPPTPSPNPENKRKLWPIVAVVAVLVLLGVGVGIVFASGLIGGPSSARVKPAVTVTSDVAAPSEPVAATQTPEQEAALTSPPVPDEFTCWGGQVVDDLGECQAPATKDEAWSYLRYVFPSIDRHTGCEQIDSTKHYTDTTVMWTCEVGDAKIRYRFWKNRIDPEKHYKSKFDSQKLLKTYYVSIDREPVNGWLKTSSKPLTQPDGSKRVVGTMWLPNPQLSLTVEADSAAIMWDRFDSARIRGTDEWLGHPSNEQPKEHPLTFAGR